MKKHVNEEHNNKERQEIQKESPPRKESKIEDLNIRIVTENEQDVDAMEETKIEENNAKETRQVEEALDMKKDYMTKIKECSSWNKKRVD